MKEMELRDKKIQLSDEVKIFGDGFVFFQLACALFALAVSLLNVIGDLSRFL